MGMSTPIILAAGGIGAANEWLHHRSDVALRMGAATLGAAIAFAAIEAIPGGQMFAVGVATIALVGVLLGNVTPGVPSPAVQLLNLFSGKGG